MVFKLNIEGTIVYIRKNDRGLYSRSYDAPPTSPKEKYISSSRSKDYGRYHKFLTQIYTASMHINGNTDKIDVELYIAVDPYDSYCFIMLSHGDCEITNSLGQKHLMKGVYSRVKFYWRYSEEVRLRDFAIFRSEYSMFEYYNSYIHSHCNFNPGTREFMHTCMGSAIINQKIKEYDKLEDIDWLQLFLYMDSYIKWESLEGGPYRKIDQLYSSWLGMLPRTIDFFKQNNITTIDVFKRPIKPKVSYSQGYLRVDKESIITSLNDKRLMAKDCSNHGYKYDPSKVTRYDHCDPIDILSYVWFNGVNLRINVNNNRSEYEQYVPAIFKFINNNIFNMIEDHINADLRKIVFEDEYEIIN